MLTKYLVNNNNESTSYPQLSCFECPPVPLQTWYWSSPCISKLGTSYYLNSSLFSWTHAPNINNIILFFFMSKQSSIVYLWHVSHPLYPFICPCILRLLPGLGYHKHWTFGCMSLSELKIIILNEGRQRKTNDNTLYRI